jgi:RUN domain-containing protein 1
LLTELEEFASRGCPNLATSNSFNLNLNNSLFHENVIDEQRKKQKELIDQLKNQLQDLESYAYESGDLEIPSSVILEKQKVIIDELKEKINLPLENFNSLTYILYLLTLNSLSFKIFFFIVV